MTYEYVCGACGHEWEAEQSISEAPLRACPRCSEESARRQVSGGAGFILKGGGWYADGYGSGKSNEAKPAPAGAKASTPKAADAVDSKPKAEPKQESTTPSKQPSS